MAVKILSKIFGPVITALGSRIEKKQFTEAPIFVGGCPRSGTTVLLSILSSHPDIFANPKELGIFNKVKLENNKLSGHLRLDRLHLSFMWNKIPKSAKRFCEKSPNNIRKYHEIDHFYNGKFKFINMVRDGRDVVLSKHPTAPNRFWTDPSTWVSDVGIGKALESNSNFYTIQYEDLILDYDQSIQKLCDFLEIHCNAEILTWLKNATVKNHIAFKNEAEDLYSKSIGKWKLKENTERVSHLLKSSEAQKLLDFYGYS